MREYCVTSIADLIHDQDNARRHTPRNIEMIQESLRRFGANRGMVAARQPDGTYRVYAGNGVLEAARNEGIDKVKLIEVSGDELPVMVVDHLSAEQLEAYAIADNRTGETSHWDLDAIQEAIDRGVEIDWMWSDDELDELFADLTSTGNQHEALTDPDDIPVIPEEPITRSGDIWTLGPHRVICGDSTDFEVVERLMSGASAKMVFTDPPWNVAIGKDSNPRHRQREGLINDDLSADDFRRFLKGFALNMVAITEGDMYVVLGASEWPTLDAVLREAGLHWSATIVWVKDQFVLGRSKYHRRYEPIWYGWRRNAKSSFDGGRAQDDVWEIPRPKVSEDHPTMKPVELVSRAIRNSSQPGQIVFDPFGGSGTTLIAAAQCDRVCYSIELDPKYVDVICRRFFEHTGIAPVRSSDGYRWGDN